MNMNAQYKQELRLLTKAQNKIDRDFAKFCTDAGKAKAEIDKRVRMASRNCDGQLKRIARRRAFLEGRLA